MDEKRARGSALKRAYGAWDNTGVPKILGDSLAHHRDRVREALFAGLMKLLDERGYDAITLADIAAAAGVGRTAVYNHFPDKESVLLGLVEARSTEYMKRLHAALAGVESPAERLAIFVRMQVVELANHHNRMAGLSVVVSEQGRHKIREHVTPLMDILTATLAEAMAAGYLPQQDVWALGLVISGATASRQTIGLSGEKLELAANVATRFILRGAGMRWDDSDAPIVAYA